MTPKIRLIMLFRRDNRQYITDFETYVMFRKIVKIDIFHLLAEDIILQSAI